jgi:hypothetical protein
MNALQPLKRWPNQDSLNMIGLRIVPKVCSGNHLEFPWIHHSRQQVAFCLDPIRQALHPEIWTQMD